MERYIDSLKRETDLASHPFFGPLRLNEVPIENFIRTQERFYHVVQFISRPMLALASNIESYSPRWKVLENIIDEHGAGDRSGYHGKTYLDFLESIGSDPSAVAGSDPHPDAEEFNRTLLSECKDRSWVRSAPMIGIMEDRFIEISSITIKFVEDTGLAQGDIPHFKLHKEIDVGHANDLYSLVSDRWGSPKDRELIESGLRDGNRMLLDLFRSICR